MNRTARSAIAITAATTLAATAVATAYAAPVDIGPQVAVIPKANTVWMPMSSTGHVTGLSIRDVEIFTETVDPADPFGGTSVNDSAMNGALQVWVGSDVYGLPEPVDGTYPYVVDVTSSGDDTLVQGGNEVLSGLEVTVQHRYYAAGDLARVLATYTNTTAAAITVDTGAYSDFGSFERTVLEGDSGHDGSVSEGDHWMITGDDGYNDPVMTTAWSKAGASLLPAFAGLGGDESVVAFELTVQPGQTVRLAYFLKIHGWENVAFSESIDGLGDGVAAAATISPDYVAATVAAAAAATEFNTFSGRLAAGLAPGTVVLNWGTVPVAPDTPADPARPATPVTGRPSFTG